MRSIYWSRPGEAVAGEPPETQARREAAWARMLAEAEQQLIEGLARPLLLAARQAPERVPTVPDLCRWLAAETRRAAREAEAQAWQAEVAQARRRAEAQIARVTGAAIARG